MANANESSPAHTKGKWNIRVVDLTKSVVADDGMVIAAGLYDEAYSPSIEEIDANACLIAVAPELLEHIETIVEMAHSVSANWESGDLALAVRSLERVATSAEAAIAKAKGKAA